ncbi:hypothetical protein Tco_1159268, partial [Tanacetum coccineum]
PFIEEFDDLMPKKCAAGNTGVFVNGRELNQKDLDLLAGRGPPTTKDRSFIIDISGKVVDEDTNEEVDFLGKLAPTVEKFKHGFGMKVPKVVPNNDEAFNFDPKLIIGASTASLMFSFNATSATNLFSQAQFRTPTASFNNNNQMSIEDSLHEDFIQTSSPAIPTFAPASAGKQLFASGTPTPSLSTVPFIFGVQTNQPPSQIPFQVQTNQYHKGKLT